MDSVAGGSLRSSGGGDSLKSQFFDPISYLNSVSSSCPPPRSHSPPSAPLPSRKRSRSASRPQTTVLNTNAFDFTGVTYPPFDLAAASASLSRPRLNLFNPVALPPLSSFSQKPQNISSTDLYLNTATSQNPSFGPQIGNSQSQILALQSSLLPLLGANQRRSIDVQSAIAGSLSSWPTGPLPDSGASHQRAASYTTNNQHQQGSSARSAE